MKNLNVKKVGKVVSDVMGGAMFSKDNFFKVFTASEEITTNYFKLIINIINIILFYSYYNI